MKKILLLLCIGFCASRLVSAQVYETGVVTVEQPDNNTWFRVDLKKAYAQKPVVIASPLTAFDSNPAQVRIKNVTTTSFEYQVEEFEYLSGKHGAESFSYLVIEQGRHVVDANGQEWEAGIITGNTDNSFKSVSFASSFGNSPTIFVQLASNSDPTAAVLRTDNITVNGFQFRIDEEEASVDPTRNPAAIPDTIHYLAVQGSNGSVGSGSQLRAYEVGTASVYQTYRTTTFTNAFVRPILLTTSQGIAGEDPFWLRHKALHSQGVKLRLQEDNSDGLNEFGHADEAVGYLVLEGEPANRRRLLWFEDFSLADRTTLDNGPTAWTTDNGNLGNDGDNYFEVRPSDGDRMMVAKNTDGEVVWRSETISINGYADVKVSAYIRGDGPPDMDGHLQLYYSIDGGPETPWLNGLQRGRFGPTTAMADELNGNALQLIIRARNTTDDDYYKIDNIRVYTESNDRYSIQNGDWNDPDTWSYTIGGPSCTCVPDKLSDTHIIDGYTVQATTGLHTRNLTAHANSRLQWISNNDLTLWGNAILDVKNQGTIERKNSNSIKFNQWNDKALDSTPDRVDDVCPGGDCPEVSVIINSDDPTGFQTYELAFNAKGTFTIQGSGNMQLLEDFDINHQARITNNLLGEINTALNFKFHYSDIEFVNYGNIVVNQNLRCLNNNGRLTNYGNFVSKGNNSINGYSLTIDNEGTIEMYGKITDVDPNEVKFYNREGATWTFGGEFFDTDIELFAHYADNEIHYNGPTDQILLTPRDVNNPTDAGPYWHLTLSNKRTTGISDSRKITRGSSLDINGNVTIIGTPEGVTTFDVDANDTDLTVAGNWELQQPEGGGTAQLSEGNENETITFDGTTDQYLRSNEHFNNLTIDKGTGKLFVLNGTRTKDEVNFLSGIIEIDAGSIFTFQGSSTVGAVSDASHVQGLVRKAGNEDFTFPIGDGSNYRPIGISDLSNSFSTTVEYFNTTPPNAEQRPDEMVSLGTCGYWEMSSSDALAMGKVTLHWDEDCPVNDISEVVVARWNGTEWVSEGRATVTGDATQGSVTTASPQNEFGLFALAERLVAPVAEDDNATTEEDTPVTIDVVANDTDNNGIDPTSVVIVQEPQHGTVSVDPLTGAVTYTPEPDYFDETIPDVFTYTVEDIKGTVSNEATVSITVTPVNDAPRVTNDQDTTNFAAVLEAVSVLANDIDIEEDNLTASLVSGPNNGTLDFRPDGTYTYTPNATFNGDDSFTYQACDDGSPSACATATVSIFVRPFNYPPRAQADTFSVEEDRTLEGNVTVNDTDINPDDILTVDTDPVQAPQHGTVALQANGSFVYTPTANYFSTDSLAYQVCDNGGPMLCDTAWVIIEVIPINDAPVAVDDEFTVIEDEEIREQVLANDYDIEGSKLVDVTEISGPTSGELMLLADGSFTYIPRRGFVGEDVFVYQVCDGQDPTLCSQATVRLRIEAGLLSIPKGFSPNGDQVGDYWHIKGITGYPGNTVTTFNRWGNIVFQVKGYDNQQILWKGEANRGVWGNQLPDGTYFYVIDLSNGQKPLSGYVVLKR